jgi:hypothetical protein
MRIKVTYTTEVPEWWRIMVRRRLGKQGLATREECRDWLRRYGESEDDNLWLAWEAMEEAIAKGETVPI